MAGYRELLRTRGVARIIAAQLTARFPNGMMSLAVLMHVQHATGSYGAAGTVLAAASVAQAVSGPVTSRWMGRWGIRPVLVTTTVVCAAALAAIAVLPLPLWGYILFGILSGLSMPPVVSAVRTIYPKLVTSRQLTTLFSLDATVQEFIWILAPVMITLVAAQAGTVVGVLMVVVILVGGGAWFILAPEVGQMRIPRSRRAFGRVLAKPTVLLATVIGLLLIGSYAAAEAALIATFGHGGIQAGLIIAVCSIGSLIGGFSFGHLPIGPWAMARRLTIIAVGLTATCFAVNVWWLGAAMFLSGLGMAPALAVMSTMTSASVKFSESAEAYGWIGTGQLIGAAAGSALAGFFIDGHGPRSAFVVAAALAVAAVLVTVVCVRWMPDLRGRDASPLPDTEPVPTIT